MSAFGVTVSAAAKAVYEEMNEKKHRYIVFYVNDKWVIEAETTGQRSATYADLLEKLRQNYANECRCLVFDYAYTKDGDAREKRVLIKWSPKQANMKQQMTYESSFSTLRKELAAISAEIVASSVEEASQEAIDARCRRQV
ncbi:hypothetical protein HPB50_003747 [Hyalomma asiaticum]|uniref:Uncharacterized protein n=1 Tax=Hyalomma asiaticum TaxID=266040 RepID=A0ACB7ST21_HYAAI|nr:hypothetical protein HPB50_003747 [Hyalomma asiaticum]